MANPGTISQTAQFKPSAAGGASSTAEFQFLDTAGTAVRMQLPLPSGGQLKNQLIRIRVGGRVDSSGATNFTGQLYYGTSATISSNTSLATTGALAVGTTVNSGWFLETTLLWESVGNNFATGYYSGAVAGTIKALTITASQTVPTVAPDAGTSVGFTVTGQFSASNASNAAYVDFFTLEVL